MSFIECSDHMKDQWSKPKPKPRFKHIETNLESKKNNIEI